MISGQRVIDLPNSMRIIPCVQVQTPADCSVKGLLFEVLRKVDEILDTRYHYNATRVGSTTDMLIGSVSTVALNHIGLLVVDEIQNVVNSKNGAVVVGMLTQLINNAGISICMVGTPKSAPASRQKHCACIWRSMTFRTSTTARLSRSAAVRRLLRQQRRQRPQPAQ